MKVYSLTDIGPAELMLKTLLLTSIHTEVSEEKFKEAVDKIDNPSAYDLFEYVPGEKVLSGLPKVREKKTHFIVNFRPL